MEQREEIPVQGEKKALGWGKPRVNCRGRAPPEAVVGKRQATGIGLSKQKLNTPQIRRFLVLAANPHFWGGAQESQLAVC